MLTMRITVILYQKIYKENDTDTYITVTSSTLGASVIQSTRTQTGNLQNRDCTAHCALHTALNALHCMSDC